MEKTYSYIEVLLCLREEYLKNEMELKKLKKLTELHDKKIADYHFECVKNYANEIFLDREIIKSKFKKIIDRIRGEAIDLSTVSDCIKDESGNYKIVGGSRKIPTILDQNAFNNQADKILESEFVKNMTNKFSLDPDDEIRFDLSSITFYKDCFRNWSAYWPHEDCLQVYSYINLGARNLLTILETPIPATKLNNWQREIVDKNYSQISDIIFPEMEMPSDNLKFGMEKEGHKVYLKQK